MRRAALVLMCSCGSGPLLGSWRFNTLVSVGGNTQPYTYTWHAHLENGATADALQVNLGGCALTVPRTSPTRAELSVSQRCDIADGGIVPLPNIPAPVSLQLSSASFEVDAHDALVTSFVGASSRNDHFSFAGKGQRD